MELAIASTSTLALFLEAEAAKKKHCTPKQRKNPNHKCYNGPKLSRFHHAKMMKRRNISTYEPFELEELTDAFNRLKNNGFYDKLVTDHYDGMSDIHRGPWFGPWHRAASWIVEEELKMPLPYWNWQDGVPPNLLKDAGFGPDGDPNNGYRVQSGPFANWQALVYDAPSNGLKRRTTPGLVRRIGSSSSTLPSSGDVQAALQVAIYDFAPWDTSVRSFRNILEGWYDGPQLHNQVHLYIGGDMEVSTSPNDPLFWLHHANTDRIWWMHQQRYGIKSYAGPGGKGVKDPMRFLQRSGVTPEDVLDIKLMNYTYV